MLSYMQYPHSTAEADSMVDTPRVYERKQVDPQCEVGLAVPARILWLRQKRSCSQRIALLESEIQARNFVMEYGDALHVTSEQLEAADLVLLDAFGQVDGTVDTIVSRIRFESRVPLVMLTDGHSTEQLVTALRAGADAIWSISTPVEILFARCDALLRRWLASTR